ncbi:ArgR family transcriptional regulator [Actinomyces marmotae]|uniref:Arginine repressor n=2 Tax=Actinomycetaceae TaxID=2049 RepID=A0A6M8B3U1_9ACTO|nr:ArgR family transcriptional regulator [Actinomyces marmotae]
MNDPGAPATRAEHLAQAVPAAPATKAARHALIRQILGHSQIRSQAELREALAERSVSTTQATLSRDLVELRATKIRTCDGALVYSVPEAGAPGQLRSAQAVVEGADENDLGPYTTHRLARWCADLLVTAEWSGGQLVLRTPAASAQLLASAVDDSMLPGVLGCIAGDDTVLVITRSEEIAARVATHLLALADPSGRR